MSATPLYLRLRNWAIDHEWSGNRMDSHGNRCPECGSEESTRKHSTSCELGHLCDDIRTVIRAASIEGLLCDLLRMLRLGWHPGRVDLVVADPPCTPWSRAGKRLGTADERDMLEVTIAIVRLLDPECWLIAKSSRPRRQAQLVHGPEHHREPRRAVGYRLRAARRSGLRRPATPCSPVLVWATARQSAHCVAHTNTRQSRRMSSTGASGRSAEALRHVPRGVVASSGGLRRLADECFEAYVDSVRRNDA